MIEVEPDDPIFFVVTEKSLQYEALELIGRKLTCEEVCRAKRIIEDGFGESSMIVYDTAIKEAVRICNS